MKKYNSPFVTPPWNSGVSVISSLKVKCTEALSTNSVNSSKSSKNFLLKVSYTNIRSILNKISFVEFYMCTKNIDLFFVTETWLNPNIINSNFCPSGYNVIRNDRLSRGEALLFLLKIVLNLLKLKVNLLLPMVLNLYALI